MYYKALHKVEAALVLVLHQQNKILEEPLWNDILGIGSYHWVWESVSSEK